MGPLDGVVVHEDQAVESDVQFPRDAPEVGFLRFPVCDETGDVLPSQNHVGVVPEHLLRDVRIILRADRQDDAALCQPLCKTLQRKVCLAGGAPLAQDDALQAIIADHSAPQRVVEVQHQALARMAAQGGEDPCHVFAIGRDRRGCDQHPGLQPASRIEPDMQSVPHHGTLEIEQGHAFPAGDFDQLLVQTPDQPPRRSRDGRVEMSEQGSFRVEEGLLDDAGALCGFQRPP